MIETRSSSVYIIVIMKRTAKILIALFVVAAVGLYIAIYGVPGMKSMLKETAVLEYGDLSVFDEAEVCIVRDETLYLAATSGKIEYRIDEGAKVRGGVSLLTLSGGEPPAADSSSAENSETTVLASISAAAGEGAEVTPDNVSPFTSMVSYFADGYEKALSPAAIESMTEESVRGIPAECASLKREYARQGEPIYKLTDNNLWYMVYWVDLNDFDEDDPEAPGAERDGYALEKTVKIDMGTTVINAVIQSYAPEGSKMKVVLRLNMYYSDMQKYRKAVARIIFAEYRGLIVNESDVVERSGEPGVFVKQRNESFKWVPIRYTKNRSVDGERIVAVGTFENADGDPVRTVNYYDEVLKAPKTQGYS
jgi:hypothetical protein